MRWNRAFKQTTVAFQFLLAFLLSYECTISHHASASCEAFVVDRKISLIGVCKETPLFFKQNGSENFVSLPAAWRCFLLQLPFEYHWENSVCPRGTHKLLTLLKLCGTQHWAHVSNIFVLYQALCCDTSFMSSTNVAITDPDRFLPNGKHSLSSLKIETFPTALWEKSQRQHQTLPLHSPFKP